MGSQDSVQGNEQKTHGAYLRVCAMQQGGKHAGRGAGGEGNKAGPAGGGSKDAGAAEEDGRPLSLSALPVTAVSSVSLLESGFGWALLAGFWDRRAIPHLRPVWFFNLNFR